MVARYFLAIKTTRRQACIARRSCVKSSDRGEIRPPDYDLNARDQRRRRIHHIPDILCHARIPAVSMVYPMRETPGTKVTSGLSGRASSEARTEARRAVEGR